MQVGTKSDRSPAVIRYNGMVWLFTVNLNHELEYTYTTSPWTCPNVDDCPAPAFPYHVLRNIGPVDGVDAAAINVNGIVGDHRRRDPARRDHLRDLDANGRGG